MAMLAKGDGKCRDQDVQLCDATSIRVLAGQGCVHAWEAKGVNGRTVKLRCVAMCCAILPRGLRALQPVSFCVGFDNR
jgi:hypothetical protein